MRIRPLGGFLAAIFGTIRVNTNLFYIGGAIGPYAAGAV